MENNLDIYAKLDEVDPTTPEKNKTIQELIAEKEQLSKAIEIKDSKLSSRDRKFRALQLSFYSLLDTARSEIQRKDEYIKELLRQNQLGESQKRQYSSIEKSREASVGCSVASNMEENGNHHHRNYKREDKHLSSNRKRYLEVSSSSSKCSRDVSVSTNRKRINEHRKRSPEKGRNRQSYSSTDSQSNHERKVSSIGKRHSSSKSSTDNRSSMANKRDYERTNSKRKRYSNERSYHSNDRQGVACKSKTIDRRHYGQKSSPYKRNKGDISSEEGEHRRSSDSTYSKNNSKSLTSTESASDLQISSQESTSENPQNDDLSITSEVYSPRSRNYKFANDCKSPAVRETYTPPLTEQLKSGGVNETFTPPLTEQNFQLRKLTLGNRQSTVRSESPAVRAVIIPSLTLQLFQQKQINAITKAGNKSKFEDSRSQSRKAAAAIKRILAAKAIKNAKNFLRSFRLKKAIRGVRQSVVHGKLPAFEKPFTTPSTTQQQTNSAAKACKSQSVGQVDDLNQQGDLRLATGGNTTDSVPDDMEIEDEMNEEAEEQGEEEMDNIATKLEQDTLTKLYLYLQSLVKSNKDERASGNNLTTSEQEGIVFDDIVDNAAKTALNSRINMSLVAAYTIYTRFRQNDITISKLTEKASQRAANLEEPESIGTPLVLLNSFESWKKTVVKNINNTTALTYLMCMNREKYNQEQQRNVELLNDIKNMKCIDGAVNHYFSSQIQRNANKLAASFLTEVNFDSFQKNPTTTTANQVHNDWQDNFEKFLQHACYILRANAAEEITDNGIQYQIELTEGCLEIMIDMMNVALPLVNYDKKEFLRGLINEQNSNSSQQSMQQLIHNIHKKFNNKYDKNPKIFENVFANLVKLPLHMATDIFNINNNIDDLTLSWIIYGLPSPNLSKRNLTIHQKEGLFYTKMKEQYEKTDVIKLLKKYLPNTESQKILTSIHEDF